MKAHEEKATRSHAVRLRMADLYAYVHYEETTTTPEIVKLFGPRGRSDLQRLWEDGRAVRWKCPEVSVEFGGHPGIWYWASIETAQRWDKEEEEYQEKKSA